MACAGLRWTAAASWHITLQFLGETSPERCKNLIEQLRTIQVAPFLVQMEDLGCFDRAGVIYAGICLSPELTALERQVVAATAVVGFAAEDRPLRPHITLARARGRTPHNLSTLLARRPQSAEFGSFLAQEFRLFESFLEPTGARYEVRGRFPLRAER